MSQFTQSVSDETIFRSPSRASEPIIQRAIINFHDNRVAVPDCLIPHHNLEEKFGILDILMRNEIPSIKDILFHYTVDCSGSMSVLCSDGRSKMEHIVHTIENMIRIFHKKAGSKISIRIQSFDSSTYVNVDTIEDLGNKSQEEIEAIILKVRQIIPQGSTNIENALKVTTAYLDKYIKDHPTTHVAHLFLTDGEITDGSDDKAYLKTLVSNTYPNIFMGYGLDHDNILLTSLASTGLHNEYRLVDNLEKAGLVYGEVIHQLLYTALEDVTLKAEHCEIYDYTTNTWTTSLDIGHLVGEQQKTYQIRTITPKDAIIAIYGRSIHQTKDKEVISNDIIFQTHAIPVPQTLEPCNLTNYLFRQKTQEFLFATRELLERPKDVDEVISDPFGKYLAACMLHTEESDTLKEAKNKLKTLQKQKDELKKNMKDFFKILLNHIETNNLKKDAFLKTLCDDIYIAIKSFDTEHGLMYAAARQTSQGRQQTYSCKPSTQEELIPDINIDNDLPPLMPPTLTRGYSVGPRSQPLPPPPALTRHNSNGSHKSPNSDPIVDPDLDLNYELSQDDISGYSGLGVLKMMREVSYNPSQDQDQELNRP
jgi:hypothetical protein